MILELNLNWNEDVRCAGRSVASAFSVLAGIGKPNTNSNTVTLTLTLTLTYPNPNPNPNPNPTSNPDELSDEPRAKCPSGETSSAHSKSRRGRRVRVARQPALSLRLFSQPK